MSQDEKKTYVLVKDVDGKWSTICGVTADLKVAQAWYWGDGHNVFEVPVDGQIKVAGYEAMEL